MHEGFVIADVERDLQSELDDAQRWIRALEDDERRWIRQGIDVEQAYRQKYNHDPQPHLVSSGGPQRWLGIFRKTDDTRRLSSGLAIGGLAVVGLFAYRRRTRRQSTMQGED